MLVNIGIFCNILFLISIMLFLGTLLGTTIVFFCLPEYTIQEKIKRFLSDTEFIPIIKIQVLITITLTLTYASYVVLAKNQEFGHSKEIGYVKGIDVSQENSKFNIVSLSTLKKFCIAADSQEYNFALMALKENLPVQINYVQIYHSNDCSVDNIVQNIATLH